ncbi:MAG: HD domain-containing protein, partial [Candidatus Marinimicrobia bacterium]|nr:HD domain-containing protein [Candidatus Neomarinimicrobiota bacterium]
MSNLSQLLNEDRANRKLLSIAGELAEQLKLNTFVVGGYVRDLLLRRPTSDIDLMVEGDGIGYAEKLSKHLGLDRIVPYEQFGTALLPLKDRQVEVATARTESYSAESRKPDITPGTVDSDMSRRDFTVNALAVSIRPGTYGDLTDPFGGVQDLRDGILRTPLDPDVTFSDDPLRMLRAARFAAQLRFELVPECLASITRQKQRMEIISWERITEETMKLLGTDQPSIGFLILKETGLLAQVFPELDVMSGVDFVNGQGHKDVFLHTLQVVDNTAMLSGKRKLRFAALVHDIAKPQTKRYDPARGWTFHHHEEAGRKMVGQIARRMKLSNELRDYLMKLTRLHLRPIALAQYGITDSAVRRLMRDAGEDVDDLMLLCRADVTTKRESRIKLYMGNFQRVEALMSDVTLRDQMRAF